MDAMLTKQPAMPPEPAFLNGEAHSARLAARGALRRTRLLFSERPRLTRNGAVVAGMVLGVVAGAGAATWLARRQPAPLGTEAIRVKQPARLWRVIGDFVLSSILGWLVRQPKPDLTSPAGLTATADEEAGLAGAASAT